MIRKIVEKKKVINLILNLTTKQKISSCFLNKRNSNISFMFKLD